MKRGLLLTAILLAVIVLALPVLTYPLGRDQGEFATIGRGILDGKTPYTELWNPKPPAVFYIYAGAMALFGRTTEALRALDLLLYPLIGAALYWIGWRLSNHRTGLFAALLFGVFYFTETFWTLTQNDGIVLLPMVLAVVCAMKAAQSHGWKAGAWAFGAGALSAYVIWFKYPFAIFAGVMVAAYSLSDQFTETPRMKKVEAALTFLLGGLVIGMGGILALQAQGAWDALVESARLTSQYTALTFNWNDFRELMGTALGFRWHQWGLLFVLAVLWPFMLRLSQPRLRRWLMVVLWLLAGLVIMLMQAKGYDYHWLPMLPPLVLLAADTLDQQIGLVARRGLARHSEIPTTFLTLLILLVLLGTHSWRVSGSYLTGREDRMAYYSRFQAGEFMADESQAVADYLTARNVPGDSLYIWGFRPEVYYLTQLNPPTRFIFQFPLVADWYPAEWRQENVDILWAALPPYALVLQVDYMPWVTGSDEDSNTLLQGYNELKDWLAFNYEPDTQIGNFFIWRRKT